MSFSGKVAIVAGGGGGMGLNIANDSIAAGAQVARQGIRSNTILPGPQGDLHHGRR